MSPPRLVYMANQIGKFFVSEDPKNAEAAILDHLEKFWDPRMRAELKAMLAADEATLHALVKEAAARLK